MTCPACGAEVPAGGRFCPSCGHGMAARGEERRVVTVIFADVVGFTALAESLDPEQVKNLVDHCFEQLVHDVAAFGGRIDKILGDAIIALFGAPLAHEDDPERAVRAALAMQQTIARRSPELTAPLQLRIGVNTGEVLTGPVAGGEYTAMGDVVNAAQRLQVAAGPGEVLVGPLTYASTREAVVYEELGPVSARGREAPIEAWRALETLVLPGRRPRNRRAALVGRDAEMTLLRHAVRLAFTRQRASLILLMGEAGVGKTRLADELAEWAEDTLDAVALEGRCVPYGEANIWYPLGSALRDACDIPADASPAGARELCEKAVTAVLGAEPEARVARVANGLLYLMGYDALRDLEPQRAREEAGRSLTEYISALAAIRPVLIRLADLHWADDLVLELIDALIDGINREPFVLVASARHILDPRWSPRPGRHHHLVMNLEPLDAADAAELLDRLLGRRVGADLREELLARSGGNPFFLEELAALVAAPSAAGAPPPARRAGGELPETLRSLIAARLDLLPAALRTVLENAAVLGSSGPLGALYRMAEGDPGFTPATVTAAIDGLVDRDMMVAEGGRWAFRSDLVREVAYGTLTKTERARRHAAIAEYIETNLAAETPDDGIVDPLAYHYGMAAQLADELGFVIGLPRDLTARALRWIGEAARRAKEADVHVLAARLFSQALDLAGAAPSAERLEFLLGRARARAGLFELAGARADVQQALAESERLGDEGRHAAARLALAEVELREGELDAAQAALEHAEPELDRLGDAVGRAEALRLKGRIALYRGDYAAAEASTTAALARFRELEDRRGEAWALQNLAWLSYLTGRVSEAETRLDRSRAAFSELGDVAGLEWSHALLAFTRFRQGDLEAAENVGEQILADAHERGDRFGEGMMLLLTALVRLWSGRTAEAVERADEARRLFRRIGDAVGRAQAQAVYGRALVSLGRIEEGFRVLDETFRIELHRAALAEPEFGALVTAASAVHIGDAERALEHARTLGPARPEVVGGEDRVVTAALALLQAGKAHEALERLEALAPPETRREAGPAALAALALAYAAVGRLGAAFPVADWVINSPRATYLDRLLAQLALGLAQAARRDAAEVIVAFAGARQLADATGDRVAQAVVRLAEAHALAAVGATAARSVRREADHLLADLGIDAAGWRTVFAGAVS